MKIIVAALLAAALVGQIAKLNYPKTRKSDHVDVYHGAQTPDAYRWLEDQNSAETGAWVQEQNKLTFSYLESIPERNAIRARLKKLWDHERYSNVFKEGNHYFFSRNDGLQNQSVLYRVASLDGRPEVLLDPNKFSKDGTIALAQAAVSPDGRTLAYGITVSGSDWREWKFLDIESRAELTDHLLWSKFSGISWSKDAKGVFYSAYEKPADPKDSRAPLYYQKLYYHRLGTPQAQDELVYERKDQKEWGFGGEVSDDGRYLIISVWKGTERKNGIFYKDLKAAQPAVLELLKDFDAIYRFIGNEGERLFFYTTWNAPRGRIIAIDLRHPERENWQEVLPQAADNLEEASYIHRTLVANYLRDAHSRIRMFDGEGKHLRDLGVPGIGSVVGFGGKQTDTETFYTFTSFTSPPTIYHYDLKTNTSRVFRQPKLEADLTHYETKQVFYRSKDGTRVPMFLTHRQGLRLDSSNPVYLYGYGGFRVSLTPAFSVSRLVWLEMGGVLAIPNLRGGGEYGDTWHQAGTKLKKQNVFDDFIAAAQWLIDNRYTSPRKLAIAGGSNGGLLVGACMTQRPELFGAAIPQVGVMDMLRFHKMTIGWAWVSDYGSADNPEEFKALRAYSPLHNLKRGVTYPATLVTTSDHDDRVVPGHSFKFAAALQAAHEGSAPVLIRIQTKAGHGLGTPISFVIEEQADIFAFLARNLNVKVPSEPRP